MKMALTRIGRDSKMIVTGDVTQIDLPKTTDSGLVKARTTLGGIEGVVFVHMNKSDIVRHPVVAGIVRAYAREEENARSAPQRRLAGEARPAAPSDRSGRRPSGRSPSGGGKG